MPCTYVEFNLVAKTRPSRSRPARSRIPVDLALVGERTSGHYSDHSMSSATTS